MKTDVKQLRTRIKSIGSALQLTNTVGLVASAKIRRASELMLKSKEYSASLEEAVLLLSSCRECEKSPYMMYHGDKRPCVAVIAGDRGLAGGYNANIFRVAREYGAAKIIPIGKRTCEHFDENGFRVEGFSYTEAKKIAENVCSDFINGRTDSFGIIYTHYHSFAEQKVTVKRLLPLQKINGDAGTAAIFEPDELTVLNKVMPEYVAGMLLSCARESFACEVAARRTAMDSAGRNARKMIDELKLEYNHARQGAITREIAEITAGDQT